MCYRSFAQEVVTYTCSHNRTITLNYFARANAAIYVYK